MLLFVFSVLYSIFYLVPTLLLFFVFDRHFIVCLFESISVVIFLGVTVNIFIYNNLDQINANVVSIEYKIICFHTALPPLCCNCHRPHHYKFFQGKSISKNLNFYLSENILFSASFLKGHFCKNKNFR